MSKNPVKQNKTKLNPSKIRENTFKLGKIGSISELKKMVIW